MSTEGIFFLDQLFDGLILLHFHLFCDAGQRKSHYVLVHTSMELSI